MSRASQFSHEENLVEAALMINEANEEVCF
jgi:hypothetical protein